MSAGCGQVGVLTGSAVWLAGWPPATSWRKGSGVVMVSEILVRRWEEVYRAYGLASQVVSNSVPGDAGVARHMARASQDVAAVWREMAAETPDMPWWSIAALSAAAQAFEYQARDWTARARYDEPLQLAQDSGRAPRAVYPIAIQHDESDGRHAGGVG